MAIRFPCQRCRQLLGIASRKAGTEITCPKCGAVQKVPSEEAAAAALAMTRFAVREQAIEESSSVMAYDDSAPFGLSRPAAGADEAASGTAEAAGEPAEPVAEGMILYHRQTLYLQGVLFAAVAVAAFAAGYFSGRGDASVQLQQRSKEAARELVLVEGKVIYDLGSGELRGDQGAVVIALPDGKLPEETLSIEGIRPGDPVPAEDIKSVQMIEKLGGAYARADTEGAFTLVLPEQGKYRLLVVSHQTDRPDSDDIDELDRDEMQRYFYRAAGLIGRHKYRWSLEAFHAGGDSVTQNFGLDGKGDS